MYHLCTTVSCLEGRSKKMHPATSHCHLGIFMKPAAWNPLFQEQLAEASPIGHAARQRCPDRC